MSGPALFRRVERMEERLGDPARWQGDPLGELQRVGAAGEPASEALILAAMLSLWTAASADAAGEQEGYRQAIAARFGRLSAEQRAAIDGGAWAEACEHFLELTAPSPPV